MMDEDKSTSYKSSPVSLINGNPRQPARLHNRSSAL